MKTLFKAAALAAITIPAAVAIPTAAQAQTVAVADLERAVQQSAAFVNAMTAMKTTYKAQIDAFTARQTALNAELQPLVTAYQTAAQQPNATQASLAPQATAIQTKRAQMQTQLEPLYQPIALAQAYVQEQIVQRLDAAVRAAMAKRRATVVLRPEAAVFFDPSTDMTAAVVAELNTLIPNAQITPPAGWQPGQSQQQPAAPTTQPQQQPQGR